VSLIFASSEERLIQLLDSEIDGYFNVISVDTMSPINRDNLLSHALSKLAPGGLLVLDNWSCKNMYPLRNHLTRDELIENLGLKDFVAVDFLYHHWVGKGTRVVMPLGTPVDAADLIVSAE